MIADLVADGSGTVAIAFAGIWDTEARYGPLIGTVTRYGIDVTPADWAPWFVWDYGLEDVVPYVRSLDRVLAEGPAWQRRRGTDRGIEIGIRWVGSEGVVAAPDGRHNWWEFQVAFTAPPSDAEQIRQLDGVIRLSKASEDKLFRMFSPEYDHRPIRMDLHRFDDGGWMDGYSGAPRWDGGPIISFGRDETRVVDLDPQVDGGAIIEATGVVDWFDDMRFDRDRFGDRPRAIWETASESDGTTVLLDSDDSWPERWPDLPWSQSGGPSVFVAVARHDSATIVTGFDDDAWPETHPADTWRAATGSAPIPTELETA